MTDSAHQPAPAKNKPIPRWIWWVCGFLLLATVARLIYGEPSARSTKSLNYAQGKVLFQAVRMYSDDHGGRYPLSLSELEPNYVGNFEGIKYRDWDSRRHYDWIYIHGVSATSPSDWIVLASPTDQISEDRERHERMVVYNDLSAVIIPADQFDRQFAAQVKAMAVQAPEKP